MKTRFSTLDIIALLPELRSKICTGWRVNQIYDCDNKTYLFKLNKSIKQMKKDDDPLSVNEETANKLTFIIESGLRMHTTDYDWPKAHAPGGFATKLRKHLRNKRIEDIRQVGVDRLVDIQFGSNEAANHLIVELYDRGNLILTDHAYTILVILRWRKPTDKSNEADATSPDDSENFRVGQTYPLNKSRKETDLERITEEKLIDLLNNARSILRNNQNYKKRNKVKQDSNDKSFDINLKDLLNPLVIYGSSLLEDKLLDHLTKDDPSLKRCIITIPFDDRGRPDQVIVTKYANLIRAALEDADVVLTEVKQRGVSPGYIVQRQQISNEAQEVSNNKKKGNSVKLQENKSLITNIDFFPILSCAERKVQQETGTLVIQEYESFDKAVDVYYCNMESQKLDSKAFSAEKEARKKLENLKLAQEKRLGDLAKIQKEDEEKARLIELNSDKVENALLIIRSLLANQISWSDIWKTILQAQAMKDPIASLITSVKFDRNEFTMRLSDPYESEDDDEKAASEQGNQKHKAGAKSRFKNVDIDISLSAYANARRFFVRRRTAVNKEKKTIEVSVKAFKNVERQTKEMLKEVVVKTNITKARKRYWFENFFWFISSDGFLVVAGRDAEQNELLVKRYMKNNDIYVHADLHGASSVIIKNESSDPVPPKTLTEAGSMAVCYSSAWDSKIATTSWWVYPKQVSKTAPAGEYLTVGAFIIRGKKNYLPLSNLVLGFGFLFRLDEESIERRKSERLAKEQSARSFDQQTSDLIKKSQMEEDEAQVSDFEDDLGASSSDEDASDAGETNDDSKQEHQVDDHVNDISDIDDDDDDDENDNKSTEHRLIDTLSDYPKDDDTLLYAIPMCGPYSALQSFKYKVKVIPGANKRGKAAKACLGVFIYDKRASQREKDLLRALKDQDYARNIPNKVKISAVNMKTITKRRPKKSEVRLPMH